MLTAFLAPILIASDAGPLDGALRATEAPKTLRAAFVVRLESDNAHRTYAFDPRLRPRDRWQLLEETGESDELDEVGAAWGAEVAPDSRLFPDDLRASLSQTVQAEDFGSAWRVNFNHRPSLNDGELDVWATERFRATAWLDPISDRFLRIDHELPRPTTGPGGVRLVRYSQSHFLESDPQFGLSFVSGIQVDIEARAAFRIVSRRYEARIDEVEFFFASAADAEAFVASRGETHQ
ncbi:MAG: hypothetical protein AAF216_12760 [Pseudomonadota bacterium]